jgi:hypothetical protein
MGWSNDYLESLLFGPDFIQNYSHLLPYIVRSPWFNALGLVNRGFATRVSVPFGESLAGTNWDGCGECVKVCPTAGVMERKAAPTA